MIKESSQNLRNRLASLENPEKRIAVIELVIFVAFALISKEAMDTFLGPYSGQVSLITTVILLTLYTHWRRQNWSSLGLRPLPGLKAKLMVIPQAILLFIAVLVIIISLTKGLDAIGLTFLSETSESELARFGDISGNLRMYLILIALSWVGAGFGEEIFFRGFLITRLQIVFQGFRFPSIFAVVLAALLFGGVHVYAQGLAGLVNAGTIGLIFGTFFVLSKGNLWPLIVVHGFINSLGFTMDFLGLAG